MSKSDCITPAEEADILWDAHLRAITVLGGAVQSPEARLLTARQKAERVLHAAQREAEALLLTSENRVRDGLPELSEAERLVRAAAAADALQELRATAEAALMDAEWASADILLKAHREAAVTLIEASMRILDGRE